MIVSTIVASIAFVTLVITTFIIINQTNILKTNNDIRLRNVVDQVNTSQQYSYEFDKRQQEQVKGLENNMDDIRVSYLTKDNAQRRLSTKRIDAETVNVGNIQLNNGLQFNSTIANASTSPNFYVQRGLTEATKNNLLINAPNEVGSSINFTSTGNVSRMQIDTSSGQVTIPNKLTTKSLQIGDRLSLNENGEWKGDINIKGNTTASNLTVTGTTILAAPLKINHTWDDWQNNATLSTWAEPNKIGASFGGPNNWSHFPWTDGNTYIRPGKINGDINIGSDDADNINIGTAYTKINVAGDLNSKNLCINNTCINETNLIKLKSL